MADLAHIVVIVNTLRWEQRFEVRYLLQPIGFVLRVLEGRVILLYGRLYGYLDIISDSFPVNQWGPVCFQ